MSRDHDKRGRFTKGNKARKRPRVSSHRITTRQIILRADEVLASNDQEATTDQLGIILAQLIEKARSGETPAATWLLDRLAPRERICLSGPLPSPTADPFAFIDELTDRVCVGELTVDQASKLANLARPLIADAELQSMRVQVDELLTIIGRLENTANQEPT